MIHNISTFKNVFQYQTAKFKNANPQLLLHQSKNTVVGQIYISDIYIYIHTHTHTHTYISDYIYYI